MPAAPSSLCTTLVSFQLPLIKVSAEMAGEESEVKLYGSLSSTCSIIHHALKLKGIPYTHEDEDLEIDPAVTLHNMPVLIVDGKAVAGCPAILEFIDEMWTHLDPPLLPADLFHRARVRLWAEFIYQKLVPDSDVIMRSSWEGQEKAVEGFKEHLGALEEGIKKQFPGRGPFINGVKPGLLDVILGSCYVWFKILGEMAGTELPDGTRTPVVCGCMEAYAGREDVREMTKPHIRRLSRVMAMRKRAALASAAASNRV